MTLTNLTKYKTTNVEDLELVYSILRDLYPDNQIAITYNWNNKAYYLNVTNEKFKADPDVPIDLNIKVVYGDSVTGDTPLLLKRGDTISIETIQNVFNNSQHRFEYPEFKLFDKSIRLEKEYSTSDYQIWTDVGWININKVIRHKTEKKIYRILTGSGVIDVTEDHSLLTSDCVKVKPAEVQVGDVLLHSFPENEQTAFTLINITEKEAYDMGFNSGKFNNIVPTSVLNASSDIKKSFFNGYYEAAGNKTENWITVRSKVAAQSLYYLMRNIGFDVSIDLKQEIYKLTILTKKDNLSSCVIKKIIELKTKMDYVYDIETEIGRFGGGIGQMVVSNTDSVFIKFKYNRDNFEKNRNDTFNLATICGENLTNDIFRRPPIEMEFEKIFQPFILLTKKRYIGKKFENPKDPFKVKAIDSKGIALTRRDYCNLVKLCYREIIDTIMNNDDNKTEKQILEEAIAVFKIYINKIDTYNVDIDDLCISAMLAKEYSCANCKKRTEWTCIRCDKCKYGNKYGDTSCKKCKMAIGCQHSFSLAHVNLTVKLLSRNEEIQVNDRIQYIFIETDNLKQKKGELAEDPKYAVEHNLKFNRLCYLEQLAKPILGLFKVVLKDNENLLDHIISEVNKKIVSYGGKALKPSDFKIDE